MMWHPDRQSYKNFKKDLNSINFSMNNILILSAGLGSRLRPLTSKKPKTLVKFYGKPLLDYQLEVSQKLNQ